MSVPLNSESKKRVVWEWILPRAKILAAALLVETAHLCSAWWHFSLDVLGWGIIFFSILKTWGQWRQAEIELIRHRRLPGGQTPRISLLTGQDLPCGTSVVVNDRGFVQNFSRQRVDISDRRDHKCPTRHLHSKCVIGRGHL